MTNRMSAADFRAAQEAKAARAPNKFHAERAQVNGITFDSKHEAKRYGELLMMERAGQIRDLDLQVPILLQGKDGPLMSRKGRPMRLTVDFAYIDVATGLTIYEDAKGKPTRDYEVRKAVAAAQGVEVHEV